MTTQPIEPPEDPDEVIPESPGVDPDWPQTTEPDSSPR